MNSKDPKYIVRGGIIAALYIILTMISTALGISSGVVQVRISEALCILPCFTPAAIPGLFVGCLAANVLSGCTIWDVVFGSLATLIGAAGTYLLRKHRYAACLPPIISNMIIVPLVLSKVYHVETAFIVLVLSIGIGEIISCGIIGQLLYSAVRKHPEIFKGLR